MKSSMLLLAGGSVILVIVTSVVFINGRTGNTATNGPSRPSAQPSTAAAQTTDSERAGQEALRGMYNHKQATNKVDNVFANERGDEATTKP